MAEKSLNDYLRDGLRPYGRTMRVENAVGPGTPDVYARLVRPAVLHLWVENKALPGWPKRATTVVQCRHYTTQQRTWHRTWRAQGHAVAVFVRVGRCYLLLDAGVACGALGYVTREALMEASLGVWHHRVDWGQWAELVVGHTWAAVLPAPCI